MRFIGVCRLTEVRKDNQHVETVELVGIIMAAVACLLVAIYMTTLVRVELAMDEALPEGPSHVLPPPPPSPTQTSCFLLGSVCVSK